MAKNPAANQPEISGGDKQIAAMNSSRARFLKLLKEDILKLDLADLDFGIYRILNYRRSEIQSFFDDRLSKVLEEAITNEGNIRIAELDVRISALKNDLDEVAKVLGLKQAFDGEHLEEKLRDTPKGSQYLSSVEERDALEAAEGFTQSEEERLYNILYTFFSRYYRDGDFEPQPRRGKNAKYSVAYNGEDIHFHWRSRDSHYIKTGEELKSYSFKNGRWRVDFELIDAYQEPDNLKGATRYFLPIAEDCRTEGTAEEGARFIVPFAFRQLSAQEAKRYEASGSEVDGTSIQERILNDLVAHIEPPPGISKVDILKNSQRYARKNRSDYFIHRHLGEFLSGELDYYLKNEFLHPESLTSPVALSDQLLKLRVLREIASQIIGLLNQIETFQARLFEKKKFVMKAAYLLPLRMVPKRNWGQILDSSKQIDEWRKHFGLSHDLSVETLSRFPNLVVDTSLLEGALGAEILESLDNLDQMTDGVLVKAENYAALRSLESFFGGRVSGTYIDPPYNTGSDEFLYKDEFARHSTWLTMMEERLRLGRALLAADGAFFASIDQREQPALRLLLDHTFGSHNLLGDVSIAKGTSTGQDASKFGSSVDHLLCYRRSDEFFPEGIPLSPKDELRFDRQDKLGQYAVLQLRKTGKNDRREDRPNLHYPISAPDGTSALPIGPGGYES